MLDDNAEKAAGFDTVDDAVIESRESGMIFRMTIWPFRTTTRSSILPKPRSPLRDD
jgi:hypothetical protein